MPWKTIMQAIGFGDGGSMRAPPVVAKGVNEDLLKIYNRLFANKGEAVVPLVHEVCSGCHMKLTTQTALRVKAEQSITHCEQCGRILFLGDS